ncbi:MAG: hypothetical protein JW715_10000 [Sedimentisphaerales bacterium]|nr:hypothetical protein [Sedimentisphaerales bacterium]
MNALIERLNQAGEIFAGFAWPMLIQSCVLILILLFVDLLLRNKVRAIFRYCLWMLVLVKLVLPTSLDWQYSIGRLAGDNLARMEPVRTTPKTDIEPPPAIPHETPSPPYITDVRPEQPIVQRPPVPEIEPQAAIAEPIEVAEPSAIIQAKLSWRAGLFLSWLAIVLAMGFLLIQRVIFVRRLVRQAQPAGDSIKYLLDECRIRMRIKSRIEIKLSAGAASPAVCGLLEPVILVPQNIAASLEPDRMRMVLLHELVHIKRGDLWVNLMQTLLQTVYFYNPLLWPANAIIRRIREQAVDEAVLVAMGKTAGDYPQTLVNIAKLTLERPALGLRLIGVVESENALSGRIKHILNRPIPKTARLGLLSLSLIIISAAILLPMAGIAHAKMSVTNNGPLDIRLVGVRPDGGQYLYDPNGKIIDKSLKLPISSVHSWKPESQHRDFIFEVPKVENQLLFNVFQKLKVSDSDRTLGGGFQNIYDQTNDPSTLVYSVTFDRKYYRHFFLFSYKVPIDYIDFTLRYYYGDRLEARCTFTGPFAIDKTYKADQNLPYSVTFQQSSNAIGTDIGMRFVTTESFDSDTPVIMYDLKGKRYLLLSGDGHSGSRGAARTYREIPLSLDEIAAVTIGEQPCEITFKNVKVKYPNLPRRTHPEYLDIMAERLNLTGMTPEQLSQYDFKNPREAIEVIDIIQGTWHMMRTFESIKYDKSKIQISELDEATQDKIHRAAAQWAGSYPVEHYGIQVGLMGKWPEFFDMAIDRLGRKPSQSHGYPYTERSWRQDNHQIAHTMVNYRLNELTIDRIQKLKQLILNTDDSGVLHDIFLYLNFTKSQETTDALWELAQNEKPWIWWSALEAWYRRVANNNRVYDKIPEKIKLRLLLIRDNLSDENLDAGANELLKEIFTPEFGKMDSGNCNTVRTKIAHNLDKKEATETYINYLRRTLSEITSRQWINNESSTYMAYYIIRTLNVWYGTNIGNLGTDETQETVEIMYSANLPGFKKLLAQAIQWYENSGDVEPVELPFAGRVIDTTGNPVAAAKLSITKTERYKDERGSHQRRVEAAHQLTDQSGRFSLILPPYDEHYELIVTADGFLAKEGLFVQPLPDGRYRYNEYNYPEDNVIIMQRPGKISGLVLGPDGQPLVDAELELFANIHYSHTAPDRTVTTDSQGKFAAEGIAAGPALLSYTKYRRVQQERGYRREYAGLCGSLILENNEGQEISDIVLDLSKSVCSLELQVTDADGEPVDAISFSFNTEMPKGSGYKYGRIFYSEEANSDGLYRFDGMPAGKWRLNISNNQYNQKEIDVELSPGKTARYKMQFDASSVRARFRMQQQAAAKKQPQKSKNENSADSNDYWGEPVDGIVCAVKPVKKILGIKFLLSRGFNYVTSGAVGLG